MKSAHHSGANFNPVNEFTHVILTVSTAGTMRIYIDGVLRVEETDGCVPLKLQRNLHYLGRAIGSTNGYFHGQISYLNIYNTKELSSNEVLEFYNKRNGEMVSPTPGPTMINTQEYVESTIDAKGRRSNGFYKVLAGMFMGLACLGFCWGMYSLIFKRR